MNILGSFLQGITGDDEISERLVARATPADRAAHGAMHVSSAAPTGSEESRALAELERIRSEMPAILERARKHVLRGELALSGWGSCNGAVQRVSSQDQSGSWYFIGDVHGDFLAWHLLFERVRQDSQFKLCFLGDLVDRGPYSVECFAALLDAADKYPGRILWIVGNHDEGLRWDHRQQRFTCSTSPAEFTDFLNRGDAGTAEGQARQDWGRLFIDVADRLPRAVLFLDGLLAAHGGFPNNDLWPDLVNEESLHSWRALRDFTWARWKPNMPRNIAYTMTKERAVSESRSGFGYADFADFCRTVEGFFHVQRLVRGHDHIAAGFEAPPKYTMNQALTLTAAGFVNRYGFVDFGATGTYRPTLALGVEKPGALPTVEFVDVPERDHLALYPDRREASPPVEDAIAIVHSASDAGEDKQ